VKLLVMLFSPVSSYHLFLRSKYLSPYSTLAQPQDMCLSFGVGDQVSHPYKRIGKIIVWCNFVWQTAASKCEVFHEVSVTISFPIFRVCWWFGSTKTDV
jgi:hypothetical protein